MPNTETGRREPMFSFLSLCLASLAIGPPVPWKAVAQSLSPWVAVTWGAGEHPVGGCPVHAGCQAANLLRSRSMPAAPSLSGVANQTCPQMDVPGEQDGPARTLCKDGGWQDGGRIGPIIVVRGWLPLQSLTHQHDTPRPCLVTRFVPRRGAAGAVAAQSDAFRRDTGVCPAPTGLPAGAREPTADTAAKRPAFSSPATSEDAGVTCTKPGLWPPHQGPFPHVKSRLKKTICHAK